MLLVLQGLWKRQVFMALSKPESTYPENPTRRESEDFRWCPTNGFVGVTSRLLFSVVNRLA